MPSKNFFSSSLASDVILTALDSFCIDKDDFFSILLLITFVDCTSILDKGYSIFCNSDKGIAMISDTNMGLRLAYVLGIISPNSRIKNVVLNI